jgi:hypothetical protein
MPATFQKVGQRFAHIVNRLVGFFPHGAEVLLRGPIKW